MSSENAAVAAATDNRIRCDHGKTAMEDCAECDPRHGQAPNRRPWRYKRGQWSRRLPSLGGDEWCRRTLVIPTWLFGTFVFPLWTCRGCEGCDLLGCDV